MFDGLLMLQVHVNLFPFIQKTSLLQVSRSRPQVTQNLIKALICSTFDTWPFDKKPWLVNIGHYSLMLGPTDQIDIAFLLSCSSSDEIIVSEALNEFTRKYLHFPLWILQGQVCLSFSDSNDNDKKVPWAWCIYFIRINGFRSIMYNPPKKI